MTNQNKKIFVGLIVMAVMLSVSVTVSTAFAQESEEETLDKPIYPSTVIVGTGAAVGEDDQGWRSHFKMGIVSEPQNSDVDAHTEYNIKRGVFIVGKHDTRHEFSVIPDTWQISVSPNMKSFNASGKVENGDGKIYVVETTGDKISDLENGNLYYVTGTVTDDDGKVYDLFYISALKDRTPTIQTTSSGIQ